MRAAIILGMLKTGLGVTRSLGRKGIEVHGVDRRRDAPGFSSRYCRSQLLLPNPNTDPGTYLKGLIEFRNHFNEKPVLFPTDDFHVEFVSQYDAVLSDYYLFNIPSASVLNNITNKSNQYEQAAKLGILMPKTISPENRNDLERATLSFPVVMKGSNSYRWQFKFQNKGVIINSFDDLVLYYEMASSKNLKVVIQEFIKGPNTNHYKVSAYYSRQHGLLGIFTTQKIRQYPVNFGIGTYLISRFHPEVISLGRKLFEGFGYTGLGSIEFKRDDRDGELKLIELNPRYWRQNIQATAANVNFPYINYVDCCGHTVTAITGFKDNVIFADVIPDFRSFIAQRRALKVSFLRWVKSVIRADCYAIFSADDLKPICGYILWMIKFAIRTLLKR